MWGETAEKCYVPQFMLQPILENAVVHGFHDASKGYAVQISAHVQGEVLHIQVKDNGTGMTKENLEKLQNYIQGEADPEKKYWYCKCESENPSVLWRRVWNSDQESKTDGYRGRDHSTRKMQSENMKKLGGRG